MAKDMTRDANWEARVARLEADRNSWARVATEQHDRAERAERLIADVDRAHERTIAALMLARGVQPEWVRTEEPTVLELLTALGDAVVRAEQVETEVAALRRKLVELELAEAEEHHARERAEEQRDRARADLTQTLGRLLDDDAEFWSVIEESHPGWRAAEIAALRAALADDPPKEGES